MPKFIFLVVLFLFSCRGENASGRLEAILLAEKFIKEQGYTSEKNNPVPKHLAYEILDRKSVV